MEENSLVTVDSLLRRVELFIEEENWEKGSEYCNRVLDIEPENARAYILLLLCKNKTKSLEALAVSKIRIDSELEYKNAYKFADDKLKQSLEEYVILYEKTEKEAEYSSIQEKIEKAKTKSEIDALIKKAEKLPSDEKTEKLLSSCRAKYNDIVEKENENIYNDAQRQMYSHELLNIERAKIQFETISAYKDSKDKIAECEERIAFYKKEKEKSKKSFRIKAALVGALVIIVIVAVKIDLMHLIFPVFGTEKEMVEFLEKTNWEISEGILGTREVKFSDGKMYTYWENGKQYANDYSISNYRAGTFIVGSYVEYIVNERNDTFKQKDYSTQYIRTDRTDLIDNALSLSETEKLDEEWKSEHLSDSSSTISNDDKVLYWMVAKEYVEASLKSPSSAKFPSITSSDISFSRNGTTYTVNAYVDADNSFGANIRQYFKVQIEIVGEKNRVISCEFY